MLMMRAMGTLFPETLLKPTLVMKDLCTLFLETLTISTLVMRIQSNYILRRWKTYSDCVKWKSQNQ
jgi:hypothetical protein